MRKSKQSPVNGPLNNFTFSVVVVFPAPPASLPLTLIKFAIAGDDRAQVINLRFRISQHRHGIAHGGLLEVPFQKRNECTFFSAEFIAYGQRRLLFAFAANFLLWGFLPKHNTDDHQGNSNERAAVDTGFQRWTQNTTQYGNHNANAKKQFASKPGEILHFEVFADDCLSSLSFLPLALHRKLTERFQVRATWLIHASFPSRHGVLAGTDHIG
jgi:hypothetical protein